MERLVDAYLFGMLSVLAGDLIYLYFAGGWTDTPFIVTVELIFLSILVVAGIVKCWLIIRGIVKPVLIFGQVTYSLKEGKMIRWLIGLFPHSKFITKLWWYYWRFRFGRNFIGMFMRIPIYKSNYLEEIR